MHNFEEMGLPAIILQKLSEMNFNTPTPIQAQAIPAALAGKDILGSAQTGTGKTGAFAIPLITKLLSNPTSMGMVITPTRELASQVMAQIQLMLGKKSKIRSALLIGGDSIQKQLMQLKAKPRIIVGTPGRMNDHLKRKSLNLTQVDTLVLDETDRMLDMGFSVQIEEIMQHVPNKPQTFLFSATFPKNIQHIAERYLQDPVRITLNLMPTAAVNIEESLVHIQEGEKYNCLLTHLNEKTGSIIVFVKTKHSAEKISLKLVKEGHQADAIHGNLRQGKRDRVIKAFRNQSYRILVATDIAARGLDIPHIEHVINYDMPQCPEDYVHRIGRTARAGASGTALNLISSSDQKKWDRISRFLNPDAKPEGKKETNKNRKSRNNKGRGKFSGKRNASSGNSSSAGAPASTSTSQKRTAAPSGKNKSTAKGKAFPSKGNSRGKTSPGKRRFS